MAVKESESKDTILYRPKERHLQCRFMRYTVSYFTDSDYSSWFPHLLNYIITYFSFILCPVRNLLLTQRNTCSSLLRNDDGGETEEEEFLLSKVQILFHSLPFSSAFSEGKRKGL
jgi:hypothetical protein